jgi:hypothetical protein
MSKPASPTLFEISSGGSNMPFIQHGGFSKLMASVKPMIERRISFHEIYFLLAIFLSLFASLRGVRWTVCLPDTDCVAIIRRFAFVFITGAPRPSWLLGGDN